jgi:hypothetical protein
VLVSCVAAGVFLVVVPAAVIAELPLAVLPSLLVMALVTSIIVCSGAFMPTLNRLAGESRLWLLRGAALSLGSACAVGMNAIVPLYHHVG